MISFNRPVVTENVTEILDSLDRGEFQAAEELLPAFYTELRRLAASKLAREKAGHTLQATALVHEAWLRVAGNLGNHDKWKSRAHFFGTAAEAMRRILIESARKKSAMRNGGGLERLDLEGLQLSEPQTSEELLVLDEALAALTAHDAVTAELVKLRYFAGLTLEEVAEVLRISVPTAKRYWVYARAWLFRRVQELQSS